jgi:two-component system CheB/CheR fusion protein
VVQNFLPILSYALGRTIAIEVRLADDLRLTVLDQGQLEVALLNLAVDAKHAMPRGGTLTIATRNVALSPGAAVDDLTGLS